MNNETLGFPRPGRTTPGDDIRLHFDNGNARSDGASQGTPSRQLTERSYRVIAGLQESLPSGRLRRPSRPAVHDS